MVSIHDFQFEYQNMGLNRLKCREEIKKQNSAYVLLYRIFLIPVMLSDKRVVSIYVKKVNEERKRKTERK